MTQNLKELVGFGLTAGELVAHFAGGGSIWTAIGKLVDLGKLVGPAFKDANLALQEYANMTDIEAAELESYVVAEFDIADDALEATIESALKIAIQLHELAKLVIKPKPVPV